MLKPSITPYFFLFGSVFQFCLTYGLVLLSTLLRIALPLEAMIFSNQVIGFGVPLILFIKVNGAKFREIIPHEELRIRNAIVILLIVILSLPFTYFLSGLTVVFFENNVADLHNNTNLFKPDAYSVIMSLFLTVALPSVFEELAYRGVVLTAFKRMSLVKSSVLCGLFFALMHLDPQQFLYTFYLGFILAIFVRATNSIYAGIWGHMAFNGISALITYASGPADAADALDLSLMSIGERFAYFGFTLAFLFLLSVLTLWFVAVILKALIIKNAKISLYKTPRNDNVEEEGEGGSRSPEPDKSFKWAFAASVLFYAGYIIAFQIIKIQDRLFT